MDYLIADKIIVPGKHEKHYTENIISLPTCYQPINDKLTISTSIPSRSTLGIPPKAFVFCAINHGYKVKPKNFSIWMSILKQVDQSILWLKHQNDWMISNLKQKASEHSIDPDRLVFAKRLRHDEYLAQFKQADLYLDTFNYNAGTTASDVLITGLPIVTKLGKTYASRMAASLLYALDMSELITTNPEEYEKTAVSLALNKSKLFAVKEKLQSNLRSSNLLNTKLYTQYLENGYIQAIQSNINGSSKQNIYVNEIND